MNHSPVIKTDGLCYYYAKGLPAISGINLVVESGTIYGFLGPNGSGKTTTLRLLLGLLHNQQGSIEIFGQPLAANRMETLKKIGSLIETPSVYGHLSARENLEVYRRVYGASLSRTTEVLAITGLADTGKKTAKLFSLGMKQRLAIALALLPNPPLLILDEPSNGLDPAGIIELRELLKTLNKNYGTTIIVSSHLLDEMEKIGSHLGIIYKGKMIFQGSLQALQHFREKDATLELNTSDNGMAMQLLAGFNPQRTENLVSLPFSSWQQVAMINRLLVQNNLDVWLLRKKEDNLEQLFIELTSN